MLSAPARRILGFALRFAAVYAVLILAWPVVRPVYRPFYCFLGNVLFEGGRASARFTLLATDDEMDVKIVLTNRESPGVRGTLANNSRSIGYLPTVSLIALVLATPIPLRRRLRALLAGLALVTAFVALRMALPIVRDFSNDDALQAYHPGAFGRWLLGVSQRAFLRAPASWFVVPTFLWILVAFRRRDWELFEDEPPEPPASMA